MIADDYPLARDPAGPFDVTVRAYGKDGDTFTFRAPWRKLPTLRECHAYIVHPDTSDLAKLDNANITGLLPMD